MASKGTSMAKTNILTEDRKTACPHCGAVYGEAVGEEQVAVGGISFVGQGGHKVVCNDCRKSFISRSPRESAPENLNTLPPRGSSDPL